MRVNIVGAGPAGLYLAILLKGHTPSARIRVVEKNPADVTWGWGVVFSGKTLDNLAQEDPVVFARLDKILHRWTDVVMLHQGQEVRVRGNPFSAIARIDILRTLQQRCLELGIHLDFGSPVLDPAPLLDADLLVGADGIGSVVRTHFSEAFEPTLSVGDNRFIWLGTEQVFTGLTLGFVENDCGTFACHAYRFSPTTSTFIAECTSDTWRRAGLDEADEATSLRYLESVFKGELGGHSLLSNHSRWIQFPEVKNRNWHHNNIVLLGDALHTAHFSIGSGTKLAMEDAIELSSCIQRKGSIAEALNAWEAVRRPAVEKLQAAAARSQTWFEEMDQKMDQSPILFAHDCMTRSGRVDMELLREQDPVFVNALETAQASEL